MIKKTYPIIAKEGWLFILILSFISLLTIFFLKWWFLGFIFVLLTLFVVQFFRDPYKDIPNCNQTDILSPADGKIVAIEKALDPYRNNKESLKISIFMNVFNVHSNKIPIDGIVTKINYHSGKFVNASLDKASLENERNVVLISTLFGKDITLVQVAGLIARRILCYIKEKDTVEKGQRYGFIRFGSRVDLYLPLEFSPNVSIGDKVFGVESIIARLN